MGGRRADPSRSRSHPPSHASTGSELDLAPAETGGRRPRDDGTLRTHYCFGPDASGRVPVRGAPATDDLRSSASALPGVSLRSGEAEASASPARAPGVRPEEVRPATDARALAFGRERVRGALLSARSRSRSEAVRYTITAGMQVLASDHRHAGVGATAASRGCAGPRACSQLKRQVARGSGGRAGRTVSTIAALNLSLREPPTPGAPASVRRRERSATMKSPSAGRCRLKYPWPSSALMARRSGWVAPCRCHAPHWADGRDRVQRTQSWSMRTPHSGWYW